MTGNLLLGALQVTFEVGAGEAVGNPVCAAAPPAIHLGSAWSWCQPEFLFQCLLKLLLTSGLPVQLFQAFDAAVRGLSLGETTTLEAKGGEWRRDLLFEALTPPDHSRPVHACARPQLHTHSGVATWLLGHAPCIPEHFGSSGHPCTLPAPSQEHGRVAGSADPGGVPAA